METVGQGIQFLEASRHADHLAVLTAGGLNFIHRNGHGFGQLHIVLSLNTAGNLINLSLCRVDQISDFALTGVAHVGNPGSRVDQTTQHRLVGNDACVVASARSGGHDGNNGVQVVHPTGSGEQTGLGQFFTHGDDVGGLAVRVEIQNCVKDDLVLGEVEVSPAKNFNHVSNSIFAQQHSTEGALLCQHIVGRCAIAAVRAFCG